MRSYKLDEVLNFRTNLNEVMKDPENRDIRELRSDIRENDITYQWSSSVRIFDARIREMELMYVNISNWDQMRQEKSEVYWSKWVVSGDEGLQGCDI